MPVLFLGFLIGLVGSLFFKVGEVIYDVMRAVGPWVQTIVGAVRQVVDVVARHAGDFFRAIAHGARAIFSNVVQPVAQSIARWYSKFKAFLDRVFGPIIKVVDWVNKFLDKVWTKVIAPILDVLEKIRLVFQGLDALGVDWAGKVADFLRQVESKIYEAFREVRTWVNTFTSWLDLLLDPRGWIRSTPFLWTFVQFGGNVVNLLARLGIDPLQMAEHRALIEQYKPTVAIASIERFRSGELVDDVGIQTAVARLRGGDIGKA